MTSIEAVRQLARTAHADQRDKQGRDYVEHHLAPIAEHLREHGEHAEMAGWLHDIVEDTPTTLTDLLEHGIPPEVVRAVDAVTRREKLFEDLGERIRAGSISLNGAQLDPSAPFGGYKQSGNGREWSDYAFDEFLEVKSLLGYSA